MPMTKGEKRWMTRCPGCDAELPEVDYLRARVAELEAFIQENVECNCTPVRVCPRCSIATKP